MTGSIVFLIPSYQPTEILCGLLRGLRLHDSSHIVVVDDGGGSDYEAIFERIKQLPGISVLTNAVNLGKGAAGQAVQNMNLALGYPETAGLL